MTESTPRRDVPAWVFVVVIALCLLGGGAFVYYWFSGASPLGAEIKLKSDVDLSQERGRGRQRDAGGPVQLQSADANQRIYLVRSGRNQMHVVDNKSGDDAFDVRLRRLLTGEPAQLGRAAMRIAADNQVARVVNVTDEQRQKLRDLKFDELLMGGTPADLTAEETAKLSAAWNSAVTWDRPPAIGGQQKVVAALEEVVNSSTDRTREALVQRTMKVKEILTPEQIRAFNQMGRPAAAPQPAARQRTPTTARSQPPVEAN